MLRRIFGELMKQFHRRIEKLVAEAQEAGAFSPAIPPADIAYLLIGFAQGLIVRWSVLGRSFRLGEEARRLLEVQLQGFAVRNGPVSR